ncbi:hypothetical protein GGR52DRAFT_170767 [Hypoxylon sp. FL1284]|nr:hypothetical protein GGR52DRAFT_170767 [Hypoxylon sp. FL1284]
MFSFERLLVVACVPATMASSYLSIRANNENVVLADCTGTQNGSDLSSEVSYYTGVPDDTPDDISVVTTGSHQSWANRTTSAFFSDTGVTFTAVLRESGDAGDYAGTGDNGYGNFTCWQMASTYLYAHDNRNCFIAYDCNHQGAPVTLPSPSASPPSIPSASSSTTASSVPETHSGLSTGAIVGLSIGVAAGVLILIAAAELQAKRPEDKGPKLPDPSNVIWQGPGVRELEAPQVYHELPSDTHPVEAHGEAIRGELDGTPSRLELHSHDLPPRYENENEVTAGAYGNAKGPV